MKICGIICEYNPLHNGHIRHIQFSKQHADTIICLMSGDFTQRGTPAAMDKYTRAKHAIMAGADIVIELPVVYAAASAQNFAHGGVRMLDYLKCDTISFGSECGDIELLKKCANALLEPDEKLKEYIKSKISEGLSYPAAVAKAMSEYDNDFSIFDRPNNLLAVEYIKQLISINSKMVPITLKRHDNYNSADVQGEYCSATAIRHAFETGRLHELSSYAPEYVLNDMEPFVHEKYQQFVHSFLNTADAEYLSKIEGVTEGLENRILANAQKSNYSEMIFSIKTKRYTFVRLQRILLAAILGVTKDIVARSKEIHPYPRVLAISKSRLDLLSHIARCCGSGNMTEAQKQLYDLDIKASNIYSSLQGKKGNKDLTMPLQKI